MHLYSYSYIVEVFSSFLQDLDIGARHIKLYLNSTLVFEGELDKGCGNQVFDYSTSIDLQGFHASDLISSPVSSGHNMRGVSPQRIDERRGGEDSTIQRHQCYNLSSETAGQAMIDMQEESHTPLPPIISSLLGSPSSTRCSPQRNSLDRSVDDEPLSHRLQTEQPAVMEHTVTTQPSSTRVTPQWLQPLNRGAPEGCETSREKPRWLVPQPSTETKSTPALSSSMLPELPCNPGRVCRGMEMTVNGGPRKTESLDLDCDLLEEFGELKTDRPISGRRSSFRNTARKPEKLHYTSTAQSSTGRRGSRLSL